MHNTFMVSLFRPLTKWKSGWLNDGICNPSEWKVLKRGPNCCLKDQAFNLYVLFKL